MKRRKREKPADPGPTFRTLLLVTPSDDVLTDAVKSALLDAWGDLPVSELAVKSVVDMAFEFKVMFPDPEFDDAARLAIAKAIHGSLTGVEAVRPEEPKSATTQPAPTTGEVADARRQLEELAQDSKTASGMGVTVRGGVYRVLKVNGMDAAVQDVVVLKRCTVSGMDASGRIFAAPGAVVNVSGMDSSVEVVQLPWAELLARAVAIREAHR
ncbi:hypothetical protein [Nocardia wallacei]|uniref:hypothetical protein n=1 Tax=Nocardia wallacei TaxID=480035 RepID=UPI002454BB6D|nr:hypothetical protein [Nocardia wallacei]